MTEQITRQWADAVNSERLMASLQQLARFGDTGDGGVNRQALTEEDFAARRWLIDYAQQLGCSVFCDDSANLFFRRPGRSDLPPIVTGSHADTQPTGGNYDGCYGVMAGLECLAALNDANITTLRPIEVVIWMNEEGCRFAPGAMGSSAFVDPSRLPHYLTSTDPQGVTLAAALEAHHRTFPKLPRRATCPFSAFIELHIEQGPVLEETGKTVGVVSGIQGVRWYHIHCQGQAAHAGTTPMTMRHDAMSLAMATTQKMTALAERLAGDGLRLTFGHWQIAPNAINTIPSQVTFSVDFRHADSAVLEAFDQQLSECLSEQCQAERKFAHSPILFDPQIVAAIDTACDALQISAQTIRSGAFHDAMYLAGHCPTGMIFVPSHQGISHNPAEFTEPADLIAGTRVLAWTLAELANQSHDME